LGKSWRDIGAKAWHYWRRALPLVISVGLVIWLVFFKVGPTKLAESLAQVNWPLLVGISFAQLIVLFLWDSYSLWWLYVQPNEKLSFWTVLYARAETAAWSAVNLEVGQAAFAVRLADVIDEPVAMMLGRSIVMGMFDFGVTTAFGLLGYILMPTRRYRYLMWICIVGLGGLIALVLTVAYVVPQSWRDWIQQHTWGRWMKWWSWKHTGWMLVQRALLAIGIFVYAGAGLAIVGVPPHPNLGNEARMVFGVIPFVLLSEAIPSAGGLGTRETVLIYLTGGPPPVILGFSLIWSVSLIIGRILIGSSSWVFSVVTGKSKQEDFGGKEKDKNGDKNTDKAKSDGV
jgi:hypothetical protein